MPALTQSTMRTARLARSLTAPFLALALSLSLAGCGGPREETPDGPEQQAAETPRRGGTAVLGMITEPASINELLSPSSIVTDEVLLRMFLRLVEEQPDFEEHPPTFAPMLAESYEWSADHKVLTFHLRKDAVWSDGVPITAEDVRWTWQAQISPDVAWDSSHMKDNIADVEVVDPHTVRFHFKRVDAKQLTDANEGVILPRHAWSKLPFSKWRENGEWFQRNLVVSGPFTLESWTPQQELVLRRNEHFYDKDLPYLDRAVIRVIPDAGSLMAQLFANQLDFVPQIINPADARRVAADPDLRLVGYWFRQAVNVTWNVENPLFADRDVRRALTLGMDRQAMVDTLWGEFGRVADSPIVANVWAHDPKLAPWPYDPAEASRILAAKGWKDTDGDGILDRDGKPFSFVLTSNAGNQSRNDAAVMIQDQLKKIGVRVEPRVIEFNKQLDDADSGAFEATIIGMGMDTSLDLTAYFHSKAIETGSNYPRYRNPEVDALIDRSVSYPDIRQAEADLHRIQQLVHQDLPYTFLWESQRLVGFNRRVQGAKPNLLFTLFNLEEWWVRPRS